MPVRSAKAQWEGNLPEGRGKMALSGGAWEGPYSFRSRFEDGKGTNPEELIAAAHAGCFSMALAAGLSAGGHPPTRIHTTAKVQFGPVPGGFAITRIDLATEGSVPGIDAAAFEKTAAEAKETWPVSK